jgi:hypothetical protein
MLIEFEDMLSKFDFLWPQKVVRVELEIIEAFLSEVFIWGEFRQISRQWQKQEKGIFGDVADGAVFFQKGGRHRLDFLVDMLVLKDKGFGVGWQKQWK